jgi:dolichyl-diphosphooligosaccharide--protein glycosyltransferase
MHISDLRKSLSSGFSKLIATDWATITTLVGIFLMALFLRSYFGLETATIDGFLLSGGSDSYYHKYIIDTVVSTGHQPYLDSMLNYPIGIPSVRPPLYDWSVAVSGIAFSPIFGSVDVSVWYSFLFSTAFWGSLTVIPLYFLTKEAFNKKIGLFAAFLLAIMPAHIQRSPLTNGDHDSFILFFVVLTFFFFLKSMKLLKEKKWITNWRSPFTIIRDFRTFLLENRKAVLYAAMAGISIGTIALAWTGFSYVIVILVIFYIVQILINRLRNRNSFGLVVCFAITIGLGLLIAFPWYAQYLRISSWFDTPFYMLAISIAFGMIFLLTEKYPWMMVIPSIFVAFALGLLVLSVIAPTIVHNFFSGFGYFIQTKAYTTIAEAQAPNFSHLALSFGAVTFYLSLFGFAWSVVLIPKKIQTDYIFLVIWIALSIYMAIAAARFIFNAAPAFAVTAAWIAFVALDKLDIKSARKTYKSIGGNRLQALRRSVKIRHVIGVLIAAFLIILPNVWFGVDASIPYEEKRDYDSQIYSSMPSIFRPGDYQEGRLWYLGAFGYSLPLKTRYWPTAYDWLSEQDSDIPISKERPAILSWWDYGFEFIQEGKHPTVADNFLNGYQLAGNFIMSQSEEDAISLLAIRLIEGNYFRYEEITRARPMNFDNEMKSLFSRHGLNASVVEDVIKNPQRYVDIVKNNPEKYGHRSSDLKNNNAKYVYLRDLLTDRFDSDELVHFYQDLMETTGKSIRYFAVDTRMFPFSAQVTGIFYAPATLSDHRIVNGAPIDFYEIRAVSEFGTEYAIDEIPPGTRITDYQLIYKDMFYNSMFYRTFAGYSGKDIGQGEGIPGLTENLAQQQILPAWNMQHFKMVYRTSYYNPYPPGDVQNHTDEWGAINFEDAVEMQRRIQEGTATGTIDPSSRTTLSNGVVVIKYYHGAFINGTVTIDGETPFSGVTVTVQDEFGIPHYSTTTDTAGWYSVQAPFGNNITLTASIGQINNLTSVGNNVLATRRFNITDEQAMRIPFDRDGDGVHDYIIRNNFVVAGGNLEGKAYIDTDSNGQFSSLDTPASGATATLRHGNVDISLDQVTNETGDFRFSSIFPGDYELEVLSQGRTFSGFSATVSAGQNNTLDANITSHVLTGRVIDENQEGLVADVFLLDETNGTTLSTVSNETGDFKFEELLYGDYSLSAKSGELGNAPVRISFPINVSELSSEFLALPAGEISGKVKLEGAGGAVAPYASLRFESHDGSVSEEVSSSAIGRFELTLPEGTYSVHSTYYSQGIDYACLAEVEIVRNETMDLDIILEESSVIKGVAYQDSETNVKALVSILFKSADGNGRMMAVTNNIGEYSLILPHRNYEVDVTEDYHFMGSLNLDSDTVFDISLGSGIAVDGNVYYDENRNNQMEFGEGLEKVNVVFTDSNMRRVDAYSESNGSYEVTLDESEVYLVSVDVHGYDHLVLGPLGGTDLLQARDLRLSPTNVTLSGSIIHDGSPLSDSVQILFSRASPGAIEASTTSSSGTYSIEIMPGDYFIHIDQEINPGEKYVDVEQELLTLEIGEEAQTKDIELVKKFELNGTISLEGFSPSELNGISMEFNGPETLNQLVNGTFKTFLTEGVYDVRAFFVDGGDQYTNLSSIDIASPSDIEFELEDSFNVVGRVLFENFNIGEELTVTFEKGTGGTANTSTTMEGDYEILLPSGDYLVEVNHTTSEGELMVKYIRYTASTDFTVQTGGTLILNLDLEKSPNNSTLYGKVFDSTGSTIAAALEFRGLEEGATDTSVQSLSNGDYTLSLHPGYYSIYSVHGEDAFLGTLRVALEENRNQDFNLQVGYKAEVTLYKDLEPVEGTVWIKEKEGNASLSISTDSLGFLEVQLPGGDYEFTSSASISERGIEVTYSNATKLELDGDTIFGIKLSKVKIHEVELFWDNSQRKKIHGNETVVYTIKVSNTGNVEDSYDLGGKPADWTFEFSPSSVSLNYGDSDNSRFVDVSITSPPDPLVKHEQLTIDALSQNSSTVKSLGVDVDIFAYKGIELGLANETPVFNNSVIEYRIEIMNTGNDDDNYTLLVANKDEIEHKGWKARFNSSGNITDTTSVTISPNTRITIGLSIEVGTEMTNVSIIAYSESDRGTDAVLTIPVSTPRVDITADDIGVDGEGLSLKPPDNLVVNILLIMVFITILSIAIIMLLRRRKK